MAQVGPAQVGLKQLGPAQLGIAQVGATQVGPLQLGPFQPGPAKVGPAQVSPVQVGPTQFGPAQVDSLKVSLPCILASDELLGFHRLDPFASAWHAVGGPGCFGIRLLSPIPGGLGVNRRGLFLASSPNRKGARSTATAGTPAAAGERERLCYAMISSVRPSTSAWSLPWMLLRCKALSRDTRIVPLISRSGNALGSDYPRYIQLITEGRLW
jgi:hypothetical protein